MALRKWKYQIVISYLTNHIQEGRKLKNRMDKQGQGAIGLGVIMMVFITTIVGVVLFQTVAQEVGGTTSTVVQPNLTFTAPANGARTDIAGQELLSTPVVSNGTGVILAGNYTVDEIVSETTGVKTISFQTDDAHIAAGEFNITYDYGADGYIDSSGARSMALLIPLFFALGIAFVALSPTLRSDLLSKMGR